jgi:hypothetical protein
MKKKYLIKRAASPQEQSLKNISNDGRKILQMLENMKFKLEQSARLLGNNPDAAKKIMQNSDIIEQTQSAVYSICYNLENLDLVPSYNESQIQMSEGAPSDAEQNPISREEDNEEEQPQEQEEKLQKEEEEEKPEEEEETEETEEEPKEEEE